MVWETLVKEYNCTLEARKLSGLVPSSQTPEDEHWDIPVETLHPYQVKRQLTAYVLALWEARPL